MLDLEQKVIFVLGKGGVGRTTISSSLGYFYARHGLKTLIIQWTIRDFISPLFNHEPVGHKQKEILPNLYVMNHDPSITLHEYFVEHLRMTLLYQFIIENQQVKKLIQSAPGLEELFFLGRIFWLVELAKEERGYEFDKIIVDSPATGHGTALFSVISTISKFQLDGPLISETKRVAALLENQKKVGTVIVTLPEELPFEESQDLFQFIKTEMNRNPLMLFINKSLNWYLKDNKIHQDYNDNFYLYNNTIQSIYNDIERKIYYEEQTMKAFKSEINQIYSVPDLIIKDPNMTNFQKIQMISDLFSSHLY